MNGYQNCILSVTKIIWEEGLILGGININCVYIDGNGNCTKKPKLLKIFKRNCYELINLREVCKLKENYCKQILKLN